MRTRFELVIASPDGARTEAELRDAGQAALREVADAESLLSLFRRDSLLSHINRTAHLDPVRIDADTFGLLTTAQEVWRLSGGVFDPTIAPRMTALGLHEHAALPGDADALGAGLQNTVLDPRESTIRFLAPLALDLGGIAKGHALDLAARALREAGIRTALLHAGTSSVLAIGHPPGADAWRIAIRRPGEGTTATGPPSDQRAPSDPSASPANRPVIELCDAALSVSGLHAGTSPAASPAAHILDPRTGHPATSHHTVAAVTAPSAALADAWSTAALVLGDRPAAMPGDLGCVLFRR